MWREDVRCAGEGLRLGDTSPSPLLWTAVLSTLSRLLKLELSRGRGKVP